MKWLWNENLRILVWPRYFAWVAMMFLLAAQQSRGAETNTIIVPPAAATSEGGGRGGPFWSPIEYQLAYSGELFSAIPEEVLITGLAWRIDRELGGSLDVVIPRFEIWASTFESPLSELSRFREANWGSDRINVFTGENVRIAGGVSPNLSDFTVAVIFDEPFRYNRGEGHLLLDIATSGVFTGRRSWMDISGDLGGLVAQLGDDAAGPQVFIGRADALQISYIPEPNVWLITALSCLILFLGRRRV